MLYVLCGLLAVGGLVLDQWLKAYMTANIPLGQARPLLPGIMELRTVHNYGAAWSSFSGQRVLLVIVTCCIVAAVAWCLVRRIVRHPVGVLACFMVVSGGIGNIIDRIRLGYVVDMLNLLFMEYPVFNVADIFVVCGAILGSIYYMWIYDKYDKKEVVDGDSDAPTE